MREKDKLCVCVCVRVQTTAASLFFFVHSLFSPFVNLTIYVPKRVGIYIELQLYYLCVDTMKC